MPFRERTKFGNVAGQFAPDAAPKNRAQNPAQGQKRKREEAAKGHRTAAGPSLHDVNVNGRDRQLQRSQKSEEKVRGLSHESHAGSKPAPKANISRKLQNNCVGKKNAARDDAQKGVKSACNLTPARQALLHARSQLPIWGHVSEIRRSLYGRKDVLLLVGETGSGKSTQVPQFLLDENWCGEGCIAITQPRRVAATSLAKRVAEEMATPLGKSSPASKVGYSVRFDNSTSPSTRIKFLTEGMLLQEMLRDPWMKQYSAVIVDEVHERSVNVDLILGFLRNIVASDRKKRDGKPFKVVVMSATANAEALFDFFDDGFTAKDAPSVGKEARSSKRSSFNKQPNGKLENGSSEASWSGISSADEKSTPSVNGRKLNGVSYGTENKTGSHKREDIRIEPSKATVEHASSDEVRSISPFISRCHIEGRQYPVETFYLSEPVIDFAEAALKAVMKIHLKEPLPGDVLVFLTGQDLVETVEKLVNEHAAVMDSELPKLLVLPLFAALPSPAQQAVFQRTPARTRKVILATNIAETSVTIPGVRFVVDSGLAKVKEYRMQLGLDSLLVKPISKSAAIQRKGRAGREALGKCYRLYTEQDYLKLAQANIPEILRCDLASALLTMKARGVDDVLKFPFLDRPNPEAMGSALLSLHRLRALDSDGAITPAGRQMARLPLPPQLSRVLIAAADPAASCVLEAIDIIASLTVENVFLPPPSDVAREDAAAARATLLRRDGDHLTLLAAVQAFAAERTDRKRWAERHVASHRALRAVLDVRRQLRAQCVAQKLLGRADVPPDDAEAPPVSEERAAAVLRCFMQGFAQNTARLMPDGSYRTLEGNQVVAIHPSSVLFGRKVEAIMYNELIFTSKCYARGVSVVQLQWYGEAVGV